MNLREFASDRQLQDFGNTHKVFGIKSEVFQTFNGIVNAPKSANLLVDEETVRVRKTSAVDVISTHSNSLRNRVKLGLRELCGKRADNIALHRVKRMKDLKGRTDWERLMLERRRKTLAVCPECHEKIHSKTISAGNKINGEPYTSRGVCTVREGVRR